VKFLSANLYLASLDVLIMSSKFESYQNRRLRSSYFSVVSYFSLSVCFFHAANLQ